MNIHTLYKKISIGAAIVASLILLISSCSQLDSTGITAVADDQTAAATITVKIGTIGQLAKAKTIALEKLILTLSCPGQDTVQDTSSISGTGGNTVKTTIGDLKAPRTWTVAAATYDENDSCIHTSAATFVTIPADTTKVTLDLTALYSMLKVSFNNIPDSVTKVTLGIDGVDTLDATYSQDTNDTVTFNFDYLPANSDGIEYALSLQAAGSFYGKDTLLYTANATILARSGVDTNYTITLNWVGPAIPEGQAAFTVTIGSVGSTKLKAWFYSKENTVNDLVREVNDFFVFPSWGLIDGIAVLSNDTIFFVMEVNDRFGIGLVRAVKGDTLDSSDYFSGPGTPFDSPDGLLILQDGRFIITDGGIDQVFIVPAGGGAPTSFANGFSSYANAAIAPAGFDGSNVDPGDVIIPSWLPPKILAVNPDTKVQKTLINTSFFTGFTSEGVGSLEFGSDGYLYTVWSDLWGNQDPPRIYRFDSDGNGELFFQYPDWDYDSSWATAFDIRLTNDWIYYYYTPHQPSQYSGKGTIFRMSLDGSINELLIDLDIECQNLETSPDGSRLFVGCGAGIKEIVLNY